MELTGHFGLVVTGKTLIENDATKNPAVKPLSHIARALGVSVDKLITGKPNEL